MSAKNKSISWTIDDKEKILDHIELSGGMDEKILCRCFRCGNSLDCGYDLNFMEMFEMCMNFAISHNCKETK